MLLAPLLRLSLLLCSAKEKHNKHAIMCLYVSYIHICTGLISCNTKDCHIIYMYFATAIAYLLYRLVNGREIDDVVY